MMRKAAFLDRDGVINIDHAYVHKIEEFDWVPGVLEAARALSEAGYLLVVVTNQWASDADTTTKPLSPASPTG